MKIRTRILALVLVLMASAAGSVGCQSAQQAQNAAFTVEQIVCMVDGIVVGGLTGTPESIAQAIQSVCPGLQSFTAQVIDFVTKYLAASPAAQMAGVWENVCACLSAPTVGMQTMPASRRRPITFLSGPRP